MLDSIETIVQQVRDAGEIPKLLVTLLTLIGTFGIMCLFLILSIRVLIFFRLYIINQFLFKRNLVKKYGRWAVVSGATDGIGLALAKQLAGRGFSVVVIGRNKEKLELTKKELEKEPNVGEVETALIDLSDPSPQNYQRLKSQLDPDNRDIGVLVNNAGLISLTFSRFGSSSVDDIRNMINVNVLGTVYLTRMILPGMVTRQRGLILNVSSQNSYLNLPYWSVYGPTKAFINNFSNTLQCEYSAHPIDIVNLTPGLVHTNLLRTASTLKTSNILVPSAQAFAACTLNAISTPVSSLCGWLPHDIYMAIGKHIQFTRIPLIINNVVIKMIVKDLQVSPIPKRKQLVVVNTNKS